MVNRETRGDCILRFQKLGVMNPGVIQNHYNMLPFVHSQNIAFASIDNLEEKIEIIDAEIELNMEINSIPGMAFALVDANGILFSKGYGVIDIRDDELKINEYTNFHIGSLSKVFVSLVIMKL